MHIPDLDVRTVWEDRKLKSYLFYALVGILVGLAVNTWVLDWFPIYAEQPLFGFSVPLAAGIAAFVASYGLWEEDWAYRGAGFGLALVFAFGTPLAANVTNTIYGWPLLWQLGVGLVFCVMWAVAGVIAMIVGYLALGIAGKLFGGYGWDSFMPPDNDEDEAQAYA